MINTLSAPIIADSPPLSDLIADGSLAPALTNAGSAVGRAAASLAFVGVLGATSELLGPAGLTVTCVLALFAIGAKFSAAMRHQA